MYFDKMFNLYLYTSYVNFKVETLSRYTFNSIKYSTVSRVFQKSRLIMYLFFSLLIFTTKAISFNDVLLLYVNV